MKMETLKKTFGNPQNQFLDSSKFLKNLFFSKKVSFLNFLITVLKEWTGVNTKVKNVTPFLRLPLDIYIFIIIIF